MGAVYEVVHANTGEHLALKLMLARSLLTRSSRAVSPGGAIHGSVKSEHVVRVVDADVAPEIDDVPFLVMELLAGRGLRAHLRGAAHATRVACCARSGARSTRRTAGDRASRSQAREPLPHRARGPPPIVKILDFGIAKIVAKTAASRPGPGRSWGRPATWRRSRPRAPRDLPRGRQVRAGADRVPTARRAPLLRRRQLACCSDVGRGPREKPAHSGASGPCSTPGSRAPARSHPKRFGTCAEQVEALAQAIAIEPGRGRGRARAWVAALGACGLAAAAWAAVHRAAPGATPAETPRAPSVSAIAPPAAAPPATTTAAPATTTLSPRAAAPTLTAEAAPSIQFAATPGCGAFVEAQGACLRAPTRRTSRRRRDRCDARPGSDLGRTVIATRADQGPVSITTFLMQ